MSVDLQIPLAILELGKNADGKLFDVKMAAIFKAGGIAKSYEKEFMNDRLSNVICAKKIAFILEATSKKEIDEILKFPKVHYNGNEVVPSGRFHIIEEELLLWSRTSLYSTLHRAGFDRYVKLFKEVFPEYADIFSSGGGEKSA